MSSDVQDILFSNATIIDGSGSERYKGNILVKDGRIHSISTDGSNDTPKDARTIDCEDGKWVLCPGFIDMHAHSDLSVLHTPSHEAKVRMLNVIEAIELLIYLRSHKAARPKLWVKTVFPTVPSTMRPWLGSESRSQDGMATLRNRQTSSTDGDR